MTANELIQKANELADKRHAATRPFVNGKGFITNAKAYQQAEANNPTEAEFNNVICQSTLFVSHTSNESHYQNRFYFRKPNGNRTNFSKAKAIEILN